MGGKLAGAVGFLRSDRLRWPLALGLGVLLWALSLPPYGFGILAVLAYIPVLFALPEEPLARVGTWGWIGGTVWEFATVWWLIPNLVRNGGMGEPVAFVLVVLMSAVLGLYTAGFLLTVGWLVRRRDEYALAVAPFAWVLWEWLRGHLFTGFPWWGPGYALSLYPPLLQVTRLFGILGLSFLTLLAATAIVLYLRDRRHFVTGLTVPSTLVLFACALLWGYWQNARPVIPRPGVAVGYLQPQVPQPQKWDPAFAGQVLKTTLDLAGSFKSYGLKLMVWPESSTPFAWDTDERYRGLVAEAAAQTGSPILLGSVLGSGDQIYNGAVLVSPEGEEVGRYEKTHLVPFGEYVPLRGVLGFARPIVETVGDFSPGQSLDPLESPAGKIGVTICYEGIFPELVRKQVRLGAQLLVNVTNDAWYEGTPGPYQHFLMERVRAVETDRYLVRSANIGVSGVVNPRGRLEATTTRGEPAAFWGLVGPRDTRTLWTRVGNLWLLLPLAVLVAVGLPGARRAVRRPL